MRSRMGFLAVRQIVLMNVLVLAALGLSACADKRPTPSLPPAPIDFALALEYAKRAALAYAPDSLIREQSSRDVQVSISPPLASGIKAYVERNDAQRVQWIVIRGTSNVINLRLDVDYNKIVDSRLQIPLHKGFGDAAVQVYQFAKPLLKPDYETRISGHSLGGAVGVIVLMLLTEDQLPLGQAMTFGQPMVTTRAGALKYDDLPLLRFVNEEDPVPFMPPFEVFAVLDEGPYVHLGPEVVLEEGRGYRYYSAHVAQRLSVLAFWNNLKNLSVQDLPGHQMAAYLRRIEQKLPAPSPAS